MRLLTITSWFPPHHTGGYEIACHDVTRMLAERGHDVAVLCSDQRFGSGAPGPLEDRVRRELRLYIEGDALLTPTWRERLRVERHNQAALARALADTRPDAVAVWHVGALSTALLSALVASGTPLVYVVCDDWPTYALELDAWAAPFARRRGGKALLAMLRPFTRVPAPPRSLGTDAASCFISERTKERCLAWSPWPMPRPVVVRQGIDGERWTARDRLAGRPWEGRLLYMGRFDPRKGVDTVLEALRLLPGTTCRFDGRAAPGERDRLAARADELGVTAQVEIGTSPGEELPDRYAEADALVFPSEWEEPFGLTPLEAMACGTPVLATCVGGSSEFLVDGVNVVRFAPGDPGDLADAVRFLAERPALRGALVASGRATAAALDIRRTTDDIEAWLEGAADRFRGALPPERPVPVVGRDPHTDGVRRSWA